MPEHCVEEVITLFLNRRFHKGVGPVYRRPGKDEVGSGSEQEAQGKGKKVKTTVHGCFSS
jgi:hypothetical protein